MKEAATVPGIITARIPVAHFTTGTGMTMIARRVAKNAMTVKTVNAVVKIHAPANATGTMIAEEEKSLADSGMEVVEIKAINSDAPIL